ncbi:MAG: DUF58 domain-containing protein [Chloroflexota bacterium]
MQTRVQIRAKTRLLAALVIVLLVLAVFDDYQGWRFLLLGLAGTWWLSHRWAQSLAEKLRLRREMRFGWAQVGDQLEERFSLENGSAFPALWAELEDHSNLPGYSADVATGVGGAAIFQWRTQRPCTRRGLFTLGPTTLHTADPLGLYQVEIHDPHSMTLMVTPPIVPLPQIEVAPGGRAGEGRPRPNAPERTVSAAGVREYAPGDSLRWVHWRTSARRDELHVRLFDSTPSGDWWILLDMQADVQAGLGARSTEEHGVILAASLADRGLRLGKAVGMVAYGQPLAWLPPREGDGQRWEILRSLALVQPARHSLGEMLARLRPTLGGYTSLVIITPNARGDWLEGLLPLLWQGAVPTVLLLDPLAFGGEGNPEGVIQELSRWGVQHHRITPDLLDRPEAQPGHKGQWEWRISPTGRAIAINPPREGWKALS